ncbi:MAG: MFS transporter [Bradyrhizobiaceae bacterium]|nr:MAG: MFS transporter [Bradyrhizobiaceae bacterium]
MTKPTRSFLRWREIPAGVWALGAVSLLMDLSSEMIHALLPVYLVTVLGASMLAVGLIEGVAEATAAIVKVFSGALSDRLGRRKFLTALGYGLAAATKPIFPLAPTIGWVVLARFVDRVGKGIRGAPRDALIADLSPAAVRGASFGLRQSLDTVGAFLGPLVAMALMLATAGSFVAVFWIAVIPAVIAVVVIVAFVREPDRPAAAGARPAPLARAELARLSASYWLLVAVAAVFTLARFSEAFLILRAQDAGLPVALVPAVLVLMNLVYAASAWPAGVLSDRVGRGGLLACGLALLILADLVLAFAGSLGAVALGVALWGLHMGLTQGLFAALVADTAPPALRGTAFGLFHLVTGLAMLAASLIAGLLWDAMGPRGTFAGGALFAAVALLALPLARRRPPITKS